MHYYLNRTDRERKRRFSRLEFFIVPWCLGCFFLFVLLQGGTVFAQYLRNPGQHIRNTVPQGRNINLHTGSVAPLPGIVPNVRYAAQQNGNNGNANDNGNTNSNGVASSASDEKNGETEEAKSDNTENLRRARPQIFTGISKPLPGESRFRPDEVSEARKRRPIIGTAVHPITPSAWYPFTPRGGVPPLNSEVVFEGAEIQSGDHIPVPTLAPYVKTNGNGNAQETGTSDSEPALSEPGPKTEQRFDPESDNQLEPKNELEIESALDEFGRENPLINVMPEIHYDGAGKEITEEQFLERLENQIIYGDPSCPEPARYRPVAGDPAIPIGEAGLLTPIGPPKSLRYGLVTDSGILNEGLVNTPYAPGQAAPKVWSNGREVTMTERAQWAEGYAPIIRRRSVMAMHTHVATRLPYYSDGLEHCPVCCQPYLCGCGEEFCRFCNPELRIGPAPVCACCDDARPCIHGRICKAQLGHGPYRELGNTSGGIACPICKEAVERVPCGCCEKCQRGETCELYKPCGECPSCLIYERCDLYRACRNCVLMNRLNSCNRCDNRINGEPCGTCDWCRQNSDFDHELCGHQEVGIRKKTIYNPYNEPKLFSAPTRIITNRFNNNASRFPIYYNPAPHYKETSNPALYGGFQRPFTHRFTCARCSNDPCDCNAPGYAGQVAYAYACKFCNRNPCACAAPICNSNMPLNPIAVTTQLNKIKEEMKPRFPEDDEPEEDMGTFQPLGDEDSGMSQWDSDSTRQAPNGAQDNSTEPLPFQREPLPFENDPPADNQQKDDQRGGSLDSLFE